MDEATLAVLAIAMVLAAALYSSVGHGGASAYLALMALFGVAPEVMRPTALALNLVVAGFGTFRFVRAGQFSLRLFLSFAVPAIPFAFIGGTIQLDPAIYRPLVGIVLWLAALRMFWRPVETAAREPTAPPLWISLPAGAGLGLLAGLTGTGGGIFLSPLILLFAWEEPRKTSGVAAAFILANSIAGLAGNYSSLQQLPPEMPVLVASAAGGALIGVWLGVSRLPRHWLLRLLGLVLLIAGYKLIFT